MEVMEAAVGQGPGRVSGGAGDAARRRPAPPGVGGAEQLAAHEPIRAAGTT